MQRSVQCAASSLTGVGCASSYQRSAACMQTNAVSGTLLACVRSWCYMCRGHGFQAAVLAQRHGQG